MSPYFGKPISEWSAITEGLIAQHPLTEAGIVECCLAAWNDIYQSKIGRNGITIGKDLFVKPQIIGALLHELIPAELVLSYPGYWRREQEVNEKDIVYIPDNKFSIELKTSSDKSKIFGNRSFAQAPTVSKKNKDGYYITLNFEQTKSALTVPEVTIIRFGWLDHTDWIPQKAESGQQASLGKDTYLYKLKTIYLKG